MITRRELDAALKERAQDNKMPIAKNSEPCYLFNQPKYCMPDVGIYNI